MNYLSKNLKFLRKQYGYKQHQVAGHLKVSVMAYNHWENGNREPDIANIQKLSKLFRVSLDYLIERDLSSQATENTTINNMFKNNVINNGVIGSIQQGV